MPDPWLSLAFSALVGSVAPVYPVAALVVGLSGLLAIGRHQSLRTLSACALLLLFAGTRVGGILAAEGAAESRIAAAIGPHARCAFIGNVGTMPVRYDGASEGETSFRVDLQLRSLSCDGQAFTVAVGDRIRLYGLRVDSSPTRGDCIEGVAEIGPVRRVRNSELGDPRPGLVRRGVVLSGVVVTAERSAQGRGLLAGIDQLRNGLRGGLDRTMARDVAGLARALVLGEEDLSDDDDSIFRRSGLVHLLAVSGSHVALVVGGLASFLRWTMVRIPALSRRYEVSRLAAALGLPLCLAYEQIAGDSGSARRATAMAVVVLLVRALGLRPHVSRTVALSVLAIWTTDPLCPFDISFSLSLCATCGLIVVGGWNNPNVGTQSELAMLLPSSVRDSLRATSAASIACLPLILACGADLPLLTIPANLFGAPIGELAALPLTNAAALGGALFGNSFPGQFLGAAASISLRTLRCIASWFGRPEFAVIRVPPPTIEQLALFAAAVPWIVKGVRWRIVAPSLVVALLGAEAWHRAHVRPHGLLAVHVLDVGQGDAILVDLPDGSAMLIDGGGEVSGYQTGARIVVPLLAMRRRTELAMVALSHPHPDHLLGLLAVSDRTRIGTFLYNGLPDNDAGEAYRKLLGGLRTHRVPLVTAAAACGHPTELGGASMELLHPCPGAGSEAFDLRGNDGSLVIRLTYGNRSALLVGDAEVATERHLVSDQRTRLHADVLKIGHHGSRSSTEEPFVSSVAPALAAISCGGRNRFGHPHPKTLEVLAGLKAEVHRTDREGAVRWSTDGDQVWWTVDAPLD